MTKNEALNQTQHSTNYWLHEIEMANIRGYKQGVESGLKEALVKRHPPKREWVGLTKDDVKEWNLPEKPTVFEFAKFVEAKLMELNA